MSSTGNNGGGGPADGNSSGGKSSQDDVDTKYFFQRSDQMSDNAGVTSNGARNISSKWSGTGDDNLLLEQVINETHFS